MFVWRPACIAAIVVSAILVISSPVVKAEGRISRASLRKIFGCPPCPISCPKLAPLSMGCEPVMEPGVCACCFQCARQAGDLCGLNTGRCARGLDCRPLPEDPDPFTSLLEGTAVCM